MNISTYEARIAALEAQLGPEPGPGTETGILSVVVEPNIPLEGGSTVNDELSAVMPVTSGNTLGFTKTPLTPLVESSTYTVTVTPGSNWYAAIDRPHEAEKGAPVSKTISIIDGMIDFLAVAAENLVDESSPHSQLVCSVGYER